jgi:hypothetical protein
MMQVSPVFFFQIESAGDFATVMSAPNGRNNLRQNFALHCNLTSVEQKEKSIRLIN